MIAFISDIHSNLAALNAVLEDIDKVGGVKRIYCLGDVIGYGPEPYECFDIVANVSKCILMGNHEHAVIHGAYCFRPSAKRAIDWTREEIKSKAIKSKMWDVICSLPERYEFGDTLLVHGSPRDPVMEYVLESDCWEGADPSKLDEIFSLLPTNCFVGHSHQPGVFTEDHCFLAAHEIPDGFDVSDGRYLVNVGSVGQPRDGDNRSCYALFTGDAVYFRRVKYDIDRTANLIRKIPELEDKLADRLYRGE